jgi:hypothetical protein
MSAPTPQPGPIPLPFVWVSSSGPLGGSVLVLGGSAR